MNIVTDYTGTGRTEENEDDYKLLYDCGHRHKNITEALDCKKQETPHGSSPAQPGGAVSLQNDMTFKCKSGEFANPKDQIGITKLALHLIPAPALARLSKVMKLGAQKYGPYNWRKTNVNLTVYLDAALRHLYSILDGEDIDTESNQHHAAHTMACMAIIIDAIELGKLIDDRPPPGNFAHLVHKLQEKKEI